MHSSDTARHRRGQRTEGLKRCCVQVRRGQKVDLQYISCKIADGPKIHVLPSPTAPAHYSRGRRSTPTLHDTLKSDDARSHATGAGGAAGCSSCANHAACDVAPTCAIITSVDAADTVTTTACRGMTHASVGQSAHLRPVEPAVRNHAVVVARGHVRVRVAVMAAQRGRASAREGDDQRASEARCHAGTLAQHHHTHSR